MMKPDIVVTTFNRLETLKKTLQYIWERTTTQYRLIVIDDFSTDGTQEYLKDLLAVGKVEDIHLRPKTRGIQRYLEDHLKMTTSDPIVFTDNDILCPKLQPDWLSRGLAAMKNHPEVGIMALNNPYENWANRRLWREPAGEVTYIHKVGGTFVFARREVLHDCVGPVKSKSPMLTLSKKVLAHPVGWKVAYLSEVYCQHNQGMSTRTGRDSTKRLAKVPSLNPDTLEPSARYRR